MIPGPTELILILLIVVVIFGAKRIPEIMGGVGKGIKSFKKSMEGEDEPETPQSLPPSSPGTPPSAPSQPPATGGEASKDKPGA